MPPLKGFPLIVSIYTGFFFSFGFLDELRSDEVACGSAIDHDVHCLTLYSDQPKHQATALFLLRTEVAVIASMPGVRQYMSRGSTQDVGAYGRHKK